MRAALVSVAAALTVRPPACYDWGSEHANNRRTVLLPFALVAFLLV
jgi:hypothetical protein